MRHWADLKGARIINTRGFSRVGEVVETAVADVGVGLVLGRSGVGKTFSVSYHASRVDRPLISIVVPAQPTPTELARRLYGALTGETDPSGTRSRLEHLALREITEQQYLVHCDECQNLRSRGFNALRTAFEQSPFPLILSGGPEFERIIERDPMMLTRVVDHARVEPLSAEDVLEAIPGYHPIYAEADLALIHEVDVVLHGVFRRWATFTKRAAEICAMEGIATLTGSVAGSALRRLPQTGSD